MNQKPYDPEQTPDFSAANELMLALGLLDDDGDDDDSEGKSL